MSETTPTSRRHIAKWSLVIICFISVGVSGRQTLWYFSHNPVFSDFRIFMTGVEMMRSGERHNLYDFDAQQRVQTRLYPATKRAGLLPFNHLAFELLYYWPVSQLPFRAAILVWALVNVGIVFVIGWLLTPYTPTLRQVTGVPLVLLLFAFYPVVYTLGEGQDSLMFLLLATASLRMMDANRPSLAGFLLALGCFKLHLALLLAFFILFLRRKLHGLAGFVGGAMIVGGISAAIVGPGVFADYFTMLRRQEAMTPWGFNPWFMPNLRGVLQWGLTPQLDLGVIFSVIFVASAIVAGVGGWIILRTRREGDFSLVYSAAILTTVLVSYHLHMQDLSIAALPIMILLDRIAAQWRSLRNPMSVVEAPVGFSRAWNVVAMFAIACLYFFRIAAGWSLGLLLHGCVLAIPMLLLWAASLRESTEDHTRMLRTDLVPAFAPK